MKTAVVCFFSTLFLVVSFTLGAQVKTNANSKTTPKVKVPKSGAAGIRPNELPVLKIEFENKTLTPGEGMVFHRNGQQYSIGMGEKLTITAEDGIEITGEYPNLKIGLKKFKEGDKFKDGTIFYVDETGQHGLIFCSMEFKTTWATFKWEITNKEINTNEFKDLNTYSTGVGSGRFNTMCMMMSDDVDLNVMDPGEPYSIPYYLKHNQNNWYVPSFDELKMIYDKRHLLDIKLDPGNRIVWSSTEGDYVAKGRRNGPRGQDMPNNWNFEGYNGTGVKLTSEAHLAPNGVKCIDFYTGKTCSIVKTYSNTVIFVQEF